MMEIVERSFLDRLLTFTETR